MYDLILKNCRLIPELTEGYEQPMGHVVLEGSTIHSILPITDAALPEAKEIIDLEGKTLLPGFIDLHTHLYFTHEDINALAVKSAAQSTFDCIECAQTKLAYGYTTLRDCGSNYNTAIETRNAIARGVIQGPRVLASGRCITPTTHGNDAFGPLYCEFDDPAQARQIVRKELAMGADFIKYMATGSVLNPGGIPGEAITTRAELQALVDAATELHSYVGAHCHGKDAILLCADCGVKTIEHATYIDQECIDRIQELGNKSAIIPTFAIVYEILEDLVAGITPRVKSLIRDVVEGMLKGSALAYKQGITMGWGTDIDLEGFKLAPFLEFKARREMGLTNLQMLRQATVESARIVGLDSVCGTIKAGKDADLIVLGGKPEENYADLAAKPEMVFARGKRFC